MARQVRMALRAIGLALAFATLNASTALATEVYNGVWGCENCVYVNDGSSAPNQLDLLSPVAGRVAIVRDPSGLVAGGPQPGGGSKCTQVESSIVLCDRLTSPDSGPLGPLPSPFARFVVFANAGDDVIRARNGLDDFISCGSGSDTVHADPGDYDLTGCESVLLP
jgi:hypothetical protein